MVKLTPGSTVTKTGLNDSIEELFGGTKVVTGVRSVESNDVVFTWKRLYSNTSTRRFQEVFNR